MTAVVLAAGRGSRMRRQGGEALTGAQAAAADAGVKAMMPFRRPFLDYVLSALADAGCTTVCLVVAPGDRRVREYYTLEHPPERVTIGFSVQETPRGTADAVLAAEACVGDAPFLVVNADNYYPADLLRRLAALDGPGLPAFRRSTLVAGGNIDAGRVLAYAVLQVAPDGTLEDIVEKPDAETARRLGDDFLVSMNCWRFDARIFEACRAIGPSARGELELPEAVRHAVRTMDVRFRVFEAGGVVLDLSRRSDVPEVGRRLDAVEARP